MAGIGGVIFSGAYEGKLILDLTGHGSAAPRADRFWSSLSPSGGGFLFSRLHRIRAAGADRTARTAPPPPTRPQPPAPPPPPPPPHPNTPPHHPPPPPPPPPPPH